MRRRSVCTPVPRPSQRSNLPTDGRTGEGRREKTASRGRRTKTTVRPSVRPTAIGLPPCRRAWPSTTRSRRAGRRAADAAGQCQAATARPHACKLPLPPVLSRRPLDRPCRVPMTYRPPAAAATAALNATASQLCPPSCSNGKIYIKNQPEPKLTNAKSNPIRPVSLVRIGGDRATPSSSSFPWWRPRLR